MKANTATVTDLPKLSSATDPFLEDGIPMPTSGAGRRPTPERLLAQKMDVGQSFLTSYKWSVTTASKWSKVLAPKRFLVRKAEGGWRIWRSR